MDDATSHANHSALWDEEAPMLNGRADLLSAEIKNESSSNPGHDTQKGGAIGGSVRSLIMKCAEAIAANDVKEAYCLVNLIREQGSASGTAEQRLAYHFAEALAAKTIGTGRMLLRALAKPSIDEFFKAFGRVAEFSPCVGLSVFFTNQMILEDMESANRLHLVDLGIGHGFRLLCLLRDLSERPGGPPHLRITGVEFPHDYRLVKADELRYKLHRYACQVGVTLEFDLVVSDNWDELQPSDLKIRPEDTDEFLVVTCMYRFWHLRDEPRKRLLANIKKMNPRLFIHAVLPSCCSSSSFVARVQASFDYYSGGFGSLEEGFQAEAPLERQIIESIAGLDILIALACFEEDRIEKPEGHRQWQAIFQRAGFRQLKLRRHIFSKAIEMTQTYQGSSNLARRGNWLLVYWKDYLIAAITAWTTDRTKL